MELQVYFKPSYDVRQVVGTNRDNFKHFRVTPSYKSIFFDSDSSAHFSAGGAVSGRPIPDLGAAIIDPNVRLRKVGRGVRKPSGRALVDRFGKLTPMA